MSFGIVNIKVAQSFLVGFIVVVNAQACQCDVGYAKMGCYHDPGSYGSHHQRPLRDLLLNWRNKIDWGDGWNQQLRDMACK
jgi:hypothetical protein